MAKSPNSKPDSSPQPNKSEAIRGALADNPRAKGKEIVAALAAKGIRVQPSLVYMIISKQRRRQRRAKREANRERMEAAMPSASGVVTIDMLAKLKSLAVEAGGMKNLKMLVDLLAE